MNYNDSPPSLMARAARLALALSSAAAVLTLGVSAVTAMPASAAGMAQIRAALNMQSSPPSHVHAWPSLFTGIAGSSSLRLDHALQRFLKNMRKSIHSDCLL